MENESMINENEALNDAYLADAPTESEATLEENGDAESDELFDVEAFDELDGLIGEFPELSRENKEELFDKERYSELRLLGATAREAYLATAKVRLSISDNRSHLSSAVPRGAKSPIGKMTANELRAARELFTGATDKEIMRLYKRVTN